MPKVKFTYALRRFFPGLQDTLSGGGTLRDILGEMECRYPGMKSYILDEQGQLRRHVNIFIDGTMINDRIGLSDELRSNSEIYIMQALSGG
jgi:molybdopterin converting factor small subunit